MGLLAALTLSSAIVGPPAAKPARRAATKAVVARLNESAGHPWIEVRLDGKGPYRLLFDTASGADLIIDRELAAELGLKSTGTRRIGDPNSPEALEADVVTIGRVEVSGLAFRKVEAISWRREFMGHSDFPRGVVGLGLFGPRLVTLDYGRGEMTVEPGELPEPDGLTVIEASFEDGIPSIPLDVAGVVFRAHLDSGSTGFVGLPLDAAKKLPLEAAPVVVGRARTANADYTVSEARLRGSLRVGSLVIENPKVRFVDLPQANLGFGLLRSLVVTVDRKNARVRLVSTGTPLAPPERPRLGIMTHGPIDGRLPVEQVVPGSPADAAGLKEGDRIVRLNGRAIADMSAPELSQALQTRPLAIELSREGATIAVVVGAK